MEAFIVELSHEEEELRKIIEPLLDSEGFELVRICLKRAQTRSMLGIFADSKDSPNGITMGNLEHISRFLSDVLDAASEDGVVPKGSYELEVSSPGLDRPLTKVSHFKVAVGERVKLRLKNPWATGIKNISGHLLSANDAALTVESDSKGGAPVEIAYNDLADAHIIFDFAQKVPEKKRKSS